MDTAAIAQAVTIARPRFALYANYKTLDYFRTTISRLIKSLYNGYIGGDFIDTLKNLITGQIIDAHVRAWRDEEGEGTPPDYLKNNAEAIINKQQQFIEPFYRDIVDARINQTSIDPLMLRGDMWANRYTEAYNDAVAKISEANGGKLVWIYGDAEHCDTCASLNGVVAFASEWKTSGFKPQSAPNDLLTCGGWQCKCQLESTDKRRTPKALDYLMNLAVSRGI